VMEGTLEAIWGSGPLTRWFKQSAHFICLSRRHLEAGSPELVWRFQHPEPDSHVVSPLCVAVTPKAT